MEQWCTHMATILTGDPVGTIDYACPVRVTRPSERNELSLIWRKALADGVIATANLALLRASMGGTEGRSANR